MQKHDGATRSIALVGLPASGKSTTGKLLAARLGLRFIDLDVAVEADAGMSVTGIFQLEGEAGFRLREARALEAVAAGEPVVMATGGGAVLAAANRALLRDKFRVVWLVVSPEAAAERLSDDTRPLLSGTDALARLLSLDEARRALYQECADVVVRGDSGDAEAVMEAVCDALD